MTKAKGLLAFFALVLLIYGTFICLSLGGVFRVSAESVTTHESTAPPTESPVPSEEPSTPPEEPDPSSTVPSEPSESTPSDGSSSSSSESSDSSSSSELSDPTPPPADSGSPDQGSGSMSESGSGSGSGSESGSEAGVESGSTEQDEYYYEDPNSYDDGTTENYYDPTTEESIVMVYPSGVTPSSSSSSSESSASSGEAAGAVANASSSAPPSSSNHTGRNLILIGVLLLILSAAGIGFFVYSMFILPYLRKRKALQSGPRLSYAGASASGLAEVPAEAESDDFYEDAYGNRYRAEELPGFLEESTGEEDPAVYQPLPPASQGQQYLEEGPFAEELPYQSYQDNSEFSPVSYYDMEPYGDSQAPLYPDASGSGNESRDIYSGREFAAPDSRPYDDGNIKYSSFRNYDPLERHRHSRDWDRYFNDIDKRY